MTAAKTMIERVAERFDLYPERLAADTAYGSAEMLDWLVDERGIEPHIPVFDKSERTDGTFSRSDFTYDHEGDAYVCPGGKTRHCHLSRARCVNDGDTLLLSGQQARLRRLPAEDPLLPEHAGAQSTALHPRRRPRHGPRYRQD